MTGGDSVKQPPRQRAITSVPMLKAVLCADCESISESRSAVCGVCGGRPLGNRGRLRRSARASEPLGDVRTPGISRQLTTLVASADPGRPT